MRKGKLILGTKQFPGKAEVESCVRARVRIEKGTVIARLENAVLFLWHNVDEKPFSDYEYAERVNILKEILHHHGIQESQVRGKKWFPFLENDDVGISQHMAISCPEFDIACAIKVLHRKMMGRFRLTVYLRLRGS